IQGFGKTGRLKYRRTARSHEVFHDRQLAFVQIDCDRMADHSRLAALEESQLAAHTLFSRVDEKDLRRPTPAVREFRNCYRLVIEWRIDIRDRNICQQQLA